MATCIACYRERTVAGRREPGAWGLLSGYRHAGAELHRRFATRALSDRDQREIGDYLVGLAARHRDLPSDAGLLWFGFLAASTGHGELHRSIQASVLLDPRQRAMLDAFQRLVGAPRGVARTWRGRVSIEAFLAGEGYDDKSRSELRFYASRFRELLWNDPDRPAALGKRPVRLLLPLSWLLARARALAVVAGIAVVVLLALLLRRPEPPLRRTANVTLRADLGQGARIVAGWSDGRWAILRTDGTPEFVAPPELRLPAFVEGAAVGDLTGDGQPEIALLTSRPFDYQGPAVLSGTAYVPPPSGVWVFTRDPTWRLLAIVPSHAGAPDPARCARVALEHWRRHEAHAEIPPELDVERRACPSALLGILIAGGELLLLQAQYGRQVLRVTCTRDSCSAPEAVVSVGADVTSGVAGERLVLGTGCWRDASASAHGLLVAGASFTYLGGRTTVARIDAERIAVLMGAPCEGLDEQQLLAARTARLSFAPGTLAFATIAADGTPQFHDPVPLPGCCGKRARLAVLHDHGTPAAIAVAYTHAEDTADARLALIDLRRPLDGRQAVILPLPRPARVTAADVDNDGEDDLLLSDAVGTSAYQVDRRAALRPIAW